MLVYRLEDEDCQGPYIGSKKEIFREMIDLHNIDDSHPSPQEDGIMFFNTIVDYSAFISIASLFDWFDEWLHLLIQNGFGIFEIEIDKRFVKFGKHQVLYDIDFVINKREITHEVYNEK